MNLFYNARIRIDIQTMSEKNVNSEQPVSFEAAMQELEQLVMHMESGELPLDKSVTAYQRGAQLIRYCSTQLEKVENQVKILEGDILKPYPETKE